MLKTSLILPSKYFELIQEESMSRKNYNIFLQQRGILSQHTCPYTPQQNGVSERKNRHLLDIVRSLLLDTSVPARFWLEALSHFCSFNLQVYLLLVLRIRLLTIVFFKSIPRILTCIHLGVYVLFFSPPIGADKTICSILTMCIFGICKWTERFSLF